MSDPRLERLMADRIDTVIALSQLMAEEMRLMQAVAGADIERMGGAGPTTGVAEERALEACQARIADLNTTLERIDIALSAPDQEE